MFIEESIEFRKIHSIAELKNILLKHEVQINLLDETCEFFDSIYLLSKYPILNVLPDYIPDKDICEKALEMTCDINKQVKQLLG